jgi:hypothetical protein
MSAVFKIKECNLDVVRRLITELGLSNNCHRYDVSTNELEFLTTLQNIKSTYERISTKLNTKNKTKVVISHTIAQLDAALKPENRATTKSATDLLTSYFKASDKLDEVTKVEVLLDKEPTVLVTGNVTNKALTDEEAKLLTAIQKHLIGKVEKASTNVLVIFN